jgi:hypothetical protein
MKSSKHPSFLLLQPSCMAINLLWLHSSSVIS